MARPRKTLAQLVRDGTFLARRAEDRQLLLGPPLDHWPAFASLQRRYAAASSVPERRAIALDFQRLVKAAHDEAGKEDNPDPASRLAAELALLGKPDTAKQLLAFFPAYLKHTKGPLRGQPFALEGWQKRFLRDFHRRDKRGQRLFRFGVLAVPRGNGKTQLAAGLALYELVARRDAPEICLLAGSKEQAGICFEFARKFVEEGPLANWVTVKGKMLICPATGGRLEVISSEGSLQHGRAPALVIVDELHAFETARQQEAYVAMTSALLKRENAYLLAITTAGHNRRSLLGRIYDNARTWPEQQVSGNCCLKISTDASNGSLVYWYGAPEGCDTDDTRIWRGCNPGRWVSIRDLRRQRHDPGLDERSFLRLHLNTWVATRQGWLPDGCWDALESDEKIPRGSDVYVGVDVGIYHDTTAVAWAYVTPEAKIIVRCKVWSPRPDQPAHAFFADGVADLELVEHFILEQLASRFRIVQLAYDPHFFHRSAAVLEKHRITPIEYLQASTPMSQAYQTFYQLAREGRLAHNGDGVLAAHIAATAAIKTERGWKLSKKNSNSPIDATTACVLAVARAQHHDQTPKPNIYWLDL
jgi:phage terminase large subunit-like protein